MQRFVVRTKPSKLKRSFGPGSGPNERLLKLRMTVTQLLRYERIEKDFNVCQETRGYMERLIGIATEKGDRDPKTMEMMDYWIMEKDLIHKMFKVIVPRYSSYKSHVLTDLYRLPRPEVGDGVRRTRKGVLELKGNPYPPVIPKQFDNRNLLTNVLIDAMKNDYYTEREHVQRKHRLRKQSADGLVDYELHDKHSLPNLR